jgi:CheY-like chemotaxis protein
MNILVIDDDLEDVELFTEAFATVDSSHKIFSANDGKEGLTIARNVMPDIIFLDINMPVMNGHDTLIAIRKHKSLKDITICMLSTTSNVEEIQWYYNAGADGFIIKPNCFKELCLSLENFVASRLNSSMVEQNKIG